MYLLQEGDNVVTVKAFERQCSLPEKQMACGSNGGGEERRSIGVRECED